MTGVYIITAISPGISLVIYIWLLLYTGFRFPPPLCSCVVSVLITNEKITAVT